MYKYVLAVHTGDQHAAIIKALLEGGARKGFRVSGVCRICGAQYGVGIQGVLDVESLCMTAAPGS